MDMPDDKDAPPTSKKTSTKPIYSKFSQQELPAWKPILTPGWVEEADMRRVAFLPHMLKMQWLIFKAIPPTRPASPNGLLVEHKMEAPIYIYYQLDNYYQNQEDRIRYLSLLTIQPTLYLLNRREYSKECVRKCIVSILFFSIIAVIVFKTSNCVDMILVNSCRYVKSRNDKQLRNKTKDNQPIVPCGLIAWSLFNDTYKFSTNNKDLTVNKKNIAWGSDQRSRFGSDVYPKNFQRGDLIGGAKLNESIPWSQQEDLIVWMRTAALPTFRKLYGKIEVDLEVNDEIEIAIENNYNTYEFGGKKKLVLSTTTVMGGKNPFLGTAYLFVGGLSLLCAIGFILLYVIKPRPLGDPSYLPWNRNPGSIK
ncbi:ALA-interacting subunit 3 [Glycine max]|nr:ALA-interacting subunit 3 [Glycine max]